jgi:uncharacterized C2H2 Zn-finger protein
MATLKCPKCDSKFSVEDGWAKAAVSTLMAAPAVRDMATQVRCPTCQYLFAEGDISHLRSSRPTRLAPILVALALAVLAWVVYQAFRP